MVNRRRQRRRVLASVVAILAVLAMIVMSIAPALAAGGQRFSHYWIEATAREDGQVAVTIDVEFDFAGEESHGIYLTYLTRQRIDDDPDHYRILTYSDFSATSPTAPADLRIETDTDGVGIYVGDPDVYVTGTHAYTINFLVDGVVNSGVGARGEDEIFWNVIGTGYETPLEDVRVTLTAPNPATKTACWYGDVGADTICDATHAEEAGVVFTQKSLRPGHALTIAAAYEGGTFAQVAPLLQERHTFRNVMGGPAIALLAGAIGLAMAILIPFGLSYLRRDEKYEGYPPGLTPPAEAPVTLGRAPRVIDPAVEFSPPPGLTPADVGMITTATSKPAFHAATLVDLAVRGYLHISPSTDKRRTGSWDITWMHNGTGGLRAYEEKLLEILFTKKDTVNLKSLPASSSKKLTKLTKQQRERLVSEGWFTSDPTTAKGAMIGIGAGVFGAGVAAIVPAASVGAGFLGVPILVAGLVVMFSARTAPKRTASGHAHHVRALGFKKYLTTAEAGQLRFEAGEDIFSANLPYAMVFGVVDRWVAVFQQLHARGEWDLSPAWYSGAVAGASLFADPSAVSTFTSSLAGLQSAASLSAMTASTSGSSGRSFGSGGGGFSGGGVGGGGGGSW